MLPQLRTLRIDYPDRSFGHVMWCPYCERLHHHGENLGPRAPHCEDNSGRSPFADTGYSPVLVGVARYGDGTQFPQRMLENERSRFYSLIEARADELRKVVLRAIIPRSQKNLRAGALRVFGSRWEVSSGAESIACGQDLLGLIAKLFAISEGVAAVRIVEAATGAQLDARAVIELAQAIDAWVARGAPRNKGRRA